MPPYQHICADKQKGILVLRFTTSRLRTPEVSHAVRDELISAVNENQAADLVLDLEKVEFVGSVALLAFLSLRRLANVERIVMCNIAENVKKIFVVCNLLTDDLQKMSTFEHAATVDDAVTLLGAQAGRGGARDA